ncbi:RDD family protein [Nocardia sp. SSK8]|uniref:RDD family protein n=1 Tax=Nocardia sp. SSK8 TaxID=3120154 RepID=UPI00300BD560
MRSSSSTTVQSYPLIPGPFPAELGRRITARVLDLLLAGVLLIPTNLLMVGAAALLHVDDSIGGILLATNMIVTPLAYEWIPMAFGGATLGKRILDLRVVRTDGTAVSWQRAALRALLNAPYVSMWLILMVLPLVNLACMLLDKPQRRGLHSRLTDTVVVDLRPRFGSQWPDHKSAHSVPEPTPEQAALGRDQVRDSPTRHT